MSAAADPRHVDEVLRRLRRRVLVHEILVLRHAPERAVAEHDGETDRLREQLAAVARSAAAAASPASRHGSERAPRAVAATPE
jgi:hypothetical protein